MNKLWKKYPFIRKQLDEFEEYLLTILKARQPLVQDAIQELAQAGGKRIRPALVLISGQLGETTLEELLPIAGAVEVMHMATLVHDDIVDEAKVRRGVPTTQSKHGQDVAVFTGDYLFAQSFLLLSGEADTDMLQKVAKAIKYICEGEIDQYENRYNLDVSLLKYFRRIRRKTAILFQASCFTGSYKADLPREQQIALAKYGKYLGMIFQITDDILDVASNQQTTGKPVGNDFSQGVYTLPVIFALDDPKVGGSLMGLLKENQIDQNAVIELIHKTDALEKTRKIIEMYAQKAREQLGKLPSIKSRMFLKDLLEYTVQRNY